MKKISRLAILGVAAVAALALAAPAANASCATAVLWGQLDATGGGANGYHYVVFPTGSASDATSVVGRYWQPGNFGGMNNGTYDDSQWIANSAGGKYLNGDNGTPGVVGCPDVEQLLVLETTGTGSKAGQAFLAVSRVDATFADATAFNYNRVLTDITLKPVSITKVSESRAGSVVTVTVAAPQASTYYTGAGPNASNPNLSLSGWAVVRKNATTAADDTRASAGWTATGTTLTNGGQGQVTVDCGTVTGQDVLLGLQANFQDAQVSNYISQAAVVKCSGNLADPSGKFKIIERQPAPRQQK